MNIKKHVAIFFHLVPTVFFTQNISASFEGDNKANSLKSQVVLLHTAHFWANAGVLLGARMHRERECAVAFETIKL